MSVTIHTGDVLAGLAKIESGTVQTCVTSPPYWGLRDYGTATWEGGDVLCDHKPDIDHSKMVAAKSTLVGTRQEHASESRTSFRGNCGKCGAVRVDSQIGLEPSPDAYVARMVEVFREVRRCLRDDGTLWLNLGDSYAANRRGGGSDFSGLRGMRGPNDKPARQYASTAPDVNVPDGLKTKDLCMIPWRVALALQADGWWLRSVIVWAKKSPMPESVTDRPTSSWEPIFLFAKGQHSTRTIQFTNLEPEFVHFSRYIGEHSSNMGTSAACVRIATAIFDATQEKNEFCLPPFYAKEWHKCCDGSDSNFVTSLPPNHRLAAYAARLLCGHTSTKEFLCKLHGSGVNLADAEHLLIRRRLVECADSPCVLVNGDGTIAVHDSGEIRKINLVHGEIVVTVPTICKYYYDAEAVRQPHSDASLARAKTPSNQRRRSSGTVQETGVASLEWQPEQIVLSAGGANLRNVWHLGPEPYAEAHFATFPTEIPRRCIMAGSKPGDLVLDPFLGSGTSLAVAAQLGRNGVGCELNPEYVKLAQDRIGRATRPNTYQSEKAVDAPLFGVTL